MFGNFGRGKREPQMDMDAVFAQIEQGLESAAEKRNRKQPLQNADDLRSVLATFQEQHTFQVSDLVTWKPRMQDRKFPAYGEPMIVVAVLVEPIYEESERATDSGSSFFHYPLDIVCGRVIQHNDDGSDPVFQTYYYDSRRLMPWVAPE